MPPSSARAARSEDDHHRPRRDTTASRRPIGSISAAWLLREATNHGGANRRATTIRVVLQPVAAVRRSLYAECLLERGPCAVEREHGLVAAAAVGVTRERARAV